jgi:glycine cleavage system H protein
MHERTDDLVANPEGLKYSKDHEWAKIDGDVATIGITDYAQNALGDIVYVELPRVGQSVAAHASIGVDESVKAVSDLFNPVAGEVVEVNPVLERDPAAVNRDAFGEGWMYKVKMADGGPADLLSAADYERLVAAG